MSVINLLGRNAIGGVGNVSRSSRRIGFSVAALMLAGTALAPSQAQVANLGGLTVSRNDFVNFPGLVGVEPSEITNGTLRLTALTPQSFSGDLTDSGGVFTLFKLGVGDLTLAGLNSFSGQTVVQGGSLTAGSATAFSANSRLGVQGSMANLATVDLNGFGQTVNGLVGNGRAVVTSSTGPAVLIIDTATNLTFNGALQGQLGITKRGTSIQSFNNTNPGVAATNATGPIRLEAGTIRIGSSNALGSGAMTVAGAATLGTSNATPLVFDNAIDLQAVLTVSSPGGHNLTLNGVITGAASLTKLGVGQLTITANSSYSGGTTLSGGRLLLGNANALGTGTVTQTQTSFIGLVNTAADFTLANNFQLNNSSLQIETPDVGVVFTFSGNIAGSPNVDLIAGNGGTVVLTGNNSFNGLVRLRSGTLGIANASGVNSAGAIRIEGGDRNIVILSPDQLVTTRLVSFVGSGALTANINTGANNVEFSNSLRDGFTGAGDTLAIVKTGTGIFTASNALDSLLGRTEATGGFSVAEGTLNLTGRMANDINVASGATLSGTGFQDVGTTTISGGATLSAGDTRNAAPAIGTLTLNNLTLGATASTIFDLGAPSIDTVAPINDLIVVSGNLDLGGSTLNFNILPGFTQGTYRLFTYAGALAGTANLGLLPVGFTYTLNTAGGNVDLEVALIDFYWDGSGPFGNAVVNGGTGTWNAANTSWTDVGGNVTVAWQNNARAFFTNVGGEVTVDGNFTYSTLFFTVDGYVLNPAAGATLGADAGTIDVAAASTATINVDLVGTNGLTKAGDGTLVLGGTNTYTGGTALTAGRINVANNLALGADALTMSAGTTLGSVAAPVTLANAIAVAGGVTIDTGTALGLAGIISGSGAVQKTGAGQLTLSGNNSFTGNFAFDAGQIVVGSNTAFGNIANIVNVAASTDGLILVNGVDVGNAAVLAGATAVNVAGTDTGTLSGAISGAAGSIDKTGTGTLIISGSNSFAGGTAITAGRLVIEDQAARGTGTTSFAAGTTLQVGLTGAPTSVTLDAVVLNGAATIDLGGTSTAIAPNALVVDGSSVVLGGAITGPGALTVVGSGRVRFDGDVSGFGGGLTLGAAFPAVTVLDLTANGIGSGVLTLNNGAISNTSGAALTLANNIVSVGGSFVMAANDVTLTGALTGGFTTQKLGTGTLSVSNAGTTTGFELAEGTLRATASNSLGTVVNASTGTTLVLDGTALTFGAAINQTGALEISTPGAGSATLSGAITGTGTITKTGIGILGLAGTSPFSGLLELNEGELNLTGSIAGGVTAATGARLTGTGSAGGNVVLNDGSILAPGTNGAGTLTFGSLSLSGLSELNFQLGAANTLGGPLNDRVIVGGGLVLDGLLNVTETVGGAFTLGIYNLFSYGTTFTNNGVLINGGLPNGLNGSIQHNGAAQQVNLVVAGPNSIVLNWDGTDFTAAVPGGQGGNGVWNATNTNWTGEAPGEINAAWADNAVGIFGGTGGSVDVASNFNFAGLGFQADGYVLNNAGGSLNTNAALGSFISVDDGLTATIDATIGGTGQLFKQGAGTLVLGGNNTLSGNVNLANGTIVLTSSTGLGTGDLLMTSGTVLAAGASGLTVNNDINISGTSTIGSGTDQLFTLAGVISGGTLNQTGAGGSVLTLTGTNTYAGGTVLNGAFTAVSRDANLGAATGAVTFNGGATLIFDNTAAFDSTRNIIGNSNINLQTTGTAPVTLGGVLSGAGGLLKQGAGTLILTNANTYQGGTGLFEGVITVANNLALSTGSVTMLDGTTLRSGAANIALANDINISGTGTIDSGTDQLFTLAGVISGDGALTKTQAGNLVLTGANTYAGGTALNDGRITVASNTALGTGRLTMAGGTTLASGAADLALANAITTLGVGTVDTAGNMFTLNGVIDGAGSLNKVSTGNLVLNGANAYAGGTTINGGTVTVGTNTALGLGGVVMADGTMLRAGVDGLALANAITINGTSTMNTQALTFTLNGVIDGTGTLAKIGTGTLVLNGANIYAGSTALNAGTIRVGNNSALSTGNLAMAAGTTLQAGAAGVTLANTIGIAGGATIDVAGQTLALGGVISGTGPLSVIDSAANAASDLTLTGVNTYTGGTIVTGTQVRVSQDSNLGNAAGGVTLNGGTLWTTASFSSARAVTLGTGGGTARVAPGTVLTLTGVVSGTSLTKIGGGELVLNAANTYAGGTSLAMGRITVGNNAALGTGALAMAGGTTLGAGANNLVLANAVSTAGVGTVDTGTNTLTLAGVVSGAGSIAKIGTGTLVLNGASSYAGGTALNAGAITVGNNAALGTGSLTMADATTLNAGVTGLTAANNITMLGAATINSGAAPSVFTLSGAISGAGSVSKTGTGVLTLAGASTYTGATTVTAGALNVTGSLVSAVTVNSGAALNGTGTVGALNVLAGGSVNPGAPGTANTGTLTVTGAATLNGTYAVNILGTTNDRISAGGTLTLGGTMTVAATTSPAFPTFNAIYTVASGATRTGTFATVTGLETFGIGFDPVVEYTATQANIRLAPQSLVTLGNRFGGISGNALEAARAFDRAVAGGYNPQAFFALYNAGSNTPRALREVSGEQRATERRVVLDTNRVFRETALDRLNLGLASMAGQQVSTSDGDNSLTFFLRGAGSWGKAQTGEAATTFQTEQVGLLTGLDWSRDGITAGGMFHYTTTDVEFGFLGGSSRVETVGGTIYGGYRKDGGVVANAGVSLSSARTNGSRAITLPGFAQSLAGRTTGTTYQVFGELAWDLAASADTRIEPFARFTFVKADMGGLTETGGIAALVAAKQNYDINVMNLGMRFGANVAGGKVALNGSAAWQGTTGDRDAATIIGIPAVGQNGNIRSVLIDRSALLLQGGLGVNLSDKIRFNLDYSGLIGKRNDDHGGRATLNFAF